MSSKRPTDFNDLHHVAGLDVVKQQLLSAISQPPRSVARGMEPPRPPIEVYSQDHQLQEGDWREGLDRTDKGMIRPHASNLEAILLNDERWQDVLAYCDFSYRIMILRQPPIPECQLGEWVDADVARLRIWFHRTWHMPPPPRAEVMDAIVVASQHNRFHPVRDYLQNLRWDSKDRLKGFLKVIFRAGGDHRYLEAVGTKFFIAAVARVMQPGCKVDTVMILEGEQGKGKSTAIGVLFGDWFSDAPIPIGDKDAYINAQGIWGYEMAELDAFNKTESTAAKAFFSQRRDRYRPPYGHSAQDFPRQTVFLGSTNQEEYLKDYSGNRRYWPVKTLTVNVELVRKYRDQFWAEAYHRYQAGERWWVDGDEVELFELEQDSRLQRDPWEDRLREFLHTNWGQHYTAHQLLTEAIEKDTHSIVRADMNRIAPIMMALGWHKKRKLLTDVTGEKRRFWVYCRPESNDDKGPDLPGDDK